jgi:hypothetical protein
MSDEIEPVNQYRQRAVRLRSMASDSVTSPAVEILLGIALHYEQLVKRCEAVKSPSVAALEFKAHGQAFDYRDATQMRPKEHAARLRSTGNGFRIANLRSFPN